MLEFLASLDTESILVWGGGIGAGLTAIGAAWQGLKRGTPTSTAVAGAIASANCRAMDLDPVLKALHRDISQLHEDHRALQTDHETLRDLLIRIEDRTRRD